MPKTRYLSKTHHQKAIRQGIYPKQRDIQPTPRCDYVSARFALPVSYVVALQEKYPDRSLNMALKQFVLDTLQPVKEI